MDTIEGVSEHYFEGAEKLLEIWFSDSIDPEASLRHIPRDVWQQILSTVNCEIISVSKNERIDAYVLSESSMFVSDNRWILKTCGKTTLLNCLKPLMDLAALKGYTEISDLFYSRKNFSRPDLQIFPHRGFCEEVEYLDSLFPDGRSYCLGSVNHDCWYLYTFSKNEMKLSIKNGMKSKLSSDPDQTIEILMQDLNPEVMNIFSKKSCCTGEEATMASGIDKLVPGMEIDDFLFDPCGYSMNGIKNNGEYMTIHITPEKNFSYVSFESNVALKNYTDLVDRVIQTFQPSKFILTIFANKNSEAYETMKELEVKFSQKSNWKRSNMQFCNFPCYNLLFVQYTKTN